MIIILLPVATFATKGFCGTTLPEDSNPKDQGPKELSVRMRLAAAHPASYQAFFQGLLAEGFTYHCCKRQREQLTTPLPLWKRPLLLTCSFKPSV